MSCLEEYSDDERTSLNDAILRVIGTLECNKGMNISQIARATGLHWKTADKVLSLLVKVSVKLEGKGIDYYDVGSSKMFLLVQKMGLDSLPREIRDLYIKSEFPEATMTQKILVKMLLKGATSSSITETISNPEQKEEIIEKKWVKERKDQSVYLTSLGIMIAKGTLKTYPDLVHDNEVDKEE